MRKNKKLTLFAFGSNCNIEELENKIQFPVKVLGRAWAPKYEPIYRYYSGSRGGGALDIRQLSDTSKLTAGALLEVSEPAMRKIEEKEGAPNYYQEQRIQVLTDDGQLQETVTFVVNPEKRTREYVAPTDEYASIVDDGMKAIGHCGTAFKQAARNLSITTPVNSIFFYGTLQKGQLRGEAFDDSEVESRIQSRTQGQLFDLESYPGAITAGSDDPWISGELVKFHDISSAILRADAIEGFYGFHSTNNLFDRRLVEVVSNDGTADIAWIYLYAQELGDAIRITDGIWK